MQNILNIVYVALGGAFGAILRYLVKFICGNTAFPFATLTVNLLGCLLIGFLGGVNREINRPFLIAGLLGAFTTFSSFGLETAELFMKGSYLMGTVNILVNNILGLALVYVGFRFGAWLFK